MKSKLNTARSAAFATAILAYLSPQTASSLTISVPVFEQISPNPTIYTHGVDFTVIEFSAPGDVTARVLAIPETSLGAGAGCEMRTLPGSQRVRSHSLLVASANFGIRSRMLLRQVQRQY
jgi:hypothetical protein